MFLNYFTRNALVHLHHFCFCRFSIFHMRKILKITMDIRSLPQQQIWASWSSGLSSVSPIPPPRTHQLILSLYYVCLLKTTWYVLLKSPGTSRIHKQWMPSGKGYSSHLFKILHQHCHSYFSTNNLWVELNLVFSNLVLQFGVQTLWVKPALWKMNLTQTIPGPATPDTSFVPYANSLGQGRFSWSPNLLMVKDGCEEEYTELHSPAIKLK